jgi:DNA gyrase subunit B
MVKVPEPEFEGQTKTRLGNPEVRQIVDAVAGEKLQRFFESNAQCLNDVCSKAVEAQSAAIAAKAARDLVSRGPRPLFLR